MVQWTLHVSSRQSKLINTLTKTPYPKYFIRRGAAVKLGPFCGTASFSLLVCFRRHLDVLNCCSPTHTITSCFYFWNGARMTPHGCFFTETQFIIKILAYIRKGCGLPQQRAWIRGCYTGMQLCNSATLRMQRMHIPNIPYSRASALVSQGNFHAAAAPCLRQCASIIFINHKASGVQRFKSFLQGSVKFLLRTSQRLNLIISTFREAFWTGQVGRQAVLPFLQATVE